MSYGGVGYTPPRAWDSVPDRIRDDVRVTRIVIYLYKKPLLNVEWWVNILRRSWCPHNSDEERGWYWDTFKFDSASRVLTWCRETPISKERLSALVACSYTHTLILRLNPDTSPSILRLYTSIPNEQIRATLRARFILTLSPYSLNNIWAIAWFLDFKTSTWSRRTATYELII